MRQFSKVRRRPISKRDRDKAITELRGCIRHVPFCAPIASKDEVDKAPPHYANDCDKENALIQAMSQTDRGLAELRANAAKGNRLAMGSLLRMIGDHVQWLDGLSYRKEQFLQSYARKAVEWPMMVSLRPRRMKEVAAHLERLEVGKTSAIASGRGARWGTGWGGKMPSATLYALVMVETIHANQWQVRFSQMVWRCRREPLKGVWEKIPRWAKDCLTLPPLSKKTSDEWFKVGWMALLEYTNGKPESIPELRVIGEHRKRHSVQTGQQRAITPRTAEVNIRNGISERIRDAMRSLARELPQN
ncbi:MAG TPA: hypothetical protein VNL17_05860 [Verrucomicrobiae bacterium]|nr:hypothetical protein [Verrucomicrobiae bacterium]